MHEKKKTEGGLRIAVLDDDSRVSATIAQYLKPLDCTVTVFDEATEFLASAERASPDILITDLYMPDIDGIEVMKRMKQTSPATEIIIISGSAEKQDAIKALKLGAFDFFEKPVDREEMTATIKRTVRYREAIQERDRFAGQLSFVTQQEARRWGIDALVGKSSAMQNVVKNIGLLQRANETSVLITGESGTGKELVARAIHFGSARSSRPFVPVNCSAIPSELAESALFGHTKGSFTGASADKQGCFETAHEGTIFLDEIGDMPAPIQIKLLRVLEDGIVIPVGRTTGHVVNVRVIAATNANLNAKIASGQFRSDLFYRLAGFNFALPALRERKTDIPLLVEHFARLLSADMGIAKPHIETSALDLLCAHDFPGNIRELKNTVERALIEACGGPVKPAHIHFLRLPLPPGAERPATETSPGSASDLLPRPAAETRTGADLPLNLQQATTILVKKAIGTANGNMAEAARLLGISRQKLYRKLAAQDTGD